MTLLCTCSAAETPSIPFSVVCSVLQLDPNKSIKAQLADYDSLLARLRTVVRVSHTDRKNEAPEDYEKYATLLHTFLDPRRHTYDHAIEHFSRFAPSPDPENPSRFLVIYAWNPCAEKPELRGLPLEESGETLQYQKKAELWQRAAQLTRTYELRAKIASMCANIYRSHDNTTANLKHRLDARKEAMRQRDIAREEQAQATRERDTAREEQAQATLERDTAIEQHAKAMRERDTAREEQAQATRERDTAIEQHAKAMRERDTAREEQAQATRERDTAREQHAKAMRERDKLSSEILESVQEVLRKSGKASYLLDQGDVEPFIPITPLSPSPKDIVQLSSDEEEGNMNVGARRSKRRRLAKR